MVNKTLNIQVNGCIPLSSFFGGMIDQTALRHNYEGWELNLNYRTSNPDIEFTLKPYQIDDVWQVNEIRNNQYKTLVINQLAVGKNGNEKIVKDKFKKDGLIRFIPTEWFRFNALEMSFKQRYTKAVNETHMTMRDELTYVDGKAVMVLRPNNLTHGILAFKVVDYTLFRQNLFEIILVEVKTLFSIRAKGCDPISYVKSLKTKISHCGLEAITESTFGVDGVYSDKFTEPDRWALTPFIEGNDQRIIKAGDGLYVHTGLHSLGENDRKLIEPTSVRRELVEEITNIMDNCITPVSGAMDLRSSDVTGLLYFIETSPAYSSERYSEEFNRHCFDEVLDLILDKHEEMIGDSNEGWEDRYDELMREEKDKMEVDHDQLTEKDIDDLKENHESS